MANSIEFETQLWDLAVKLKASPQSFFYDLSPEALKTCLKVASLTVLGEIPLTDLELDQMRSVCLFTDSYVPPRGLSWVKQQFMDVGPHEEVYDKFRKPLYR